MEQCAGWVQEARDSLRGRRLFTLLAVVNLVNYLDRGVIPGGSEEFNGFIQKTLHTDRPDVFLGILQSGFILGFSAACFVFPSLARRRSPFSLMAAGLGMWCGAAVFAGVAKPLGSYAVLLMARLLSGVGEASFVTVVPPLITDTAPPGERGLWLALFYTAQPVGAGIGYVYGSALANSCLGWPWAFYFEAFFMAPLAMACSLVPRDRAMAVSNASDYGAPPGSTATPTTDTTGNLSGSPKDGESSGMAESPKVEQGYGSPARAEGSSSAVSSSVATPSPEGDLRRRPDREKKRLLGVCDGAGGGDGGGDSSGEGEGSSSSWGLLEHEPGGWAGERDKTWVEEEDTAEMSRGGSQRHYPEEVDGISGGGLVVVSPPGGGGGGGGGEGEGGASIGGEGHDPTVRLLGSLNSGQSPCCSPGEDSIGTTAAAGRKRRRRIPQPTTTATTSSVFALQDVLEVADRPVFCLVVLGSAATAAVSVGMSTFCTSIVTSLEFLPSESAAAATFGCVICAAGLVGTPAGGALIDAADPEGRLGDERKLAMVLSQATALMCVATVLLVASTVQSSLIPFLFFFFFGGALLFATASHSNLAVMLSSPRHLRPLAIAVNSIVMHALGDVPSPTLIGWAKDALAPHCVAGEAASGGSAFLRGSESVVGPAARGLGGLLRAGRVLGGVSDACRGERRGLHLTLLIIALWLLWTCLFFGLARAVQQSALEYGVLPVSWGDIRGLISKGLFRPGWPSRWRVWWRERGRSVQRKPALWIDEIEDGGYDNGVGSSLEEALLPPASLPLPSPLTPTSLVD
ncbi:conserved unknown protein [Ectocarpus siliculosus]|uniref:Major facilitator superfamily (MFS) profile domain-containing protein n=1 Tax=Ectocarpus siliculosus TaxID=2880 RepID=D7FMS4_ECTSI|nr:conserved unknown protein [Ectocarpus siliculosus]|eukprot:CBJ29989.1 conserved unknown protein [Ectocarpus siliculosus]